MNVAILYGGKSGEHEISLLSATAIWKNISRMHNVTLIGISKSGKWYLQGKTLAKKVFESGEDLSIIEKAENEVFVVPSGKTKAFRTATKTLNIDVVFPVLHGSYGEDGKIQGLFEMADIAYVGCGVLSSSVTMDKEKAKQIAETVGVKVVPYICIRRRELNNSFVYDEIVKNAIEKLGFPLFVKPSSAGSSNGATKASNEKSLSYALMEAFLWDDKVLIEKAMNVREIECSVTGNSLIASEENDNDLVKAYIPGEILPTHEFYDFDAKYNDPDGADFKIPADLSVDMTETIRSTAVKVYKALDCSGLSRVDFFIDKETGELYFNEINSMPGFTAISMFPKMCGKADVPFGALIDLLLDEAVSVYKAKENVKVSRE